MSEPTAYFFSPDLLATVTEIPADSIVSRQLYRGDHLKAIVFGFAQGQELSEHTASVPAILQILSGKARLTLGKDAHQDVEAGAWAYMQANLAHSVYAETPVKMLLIMLSE